MYLIVYLFNEIKWIIKLNLFIGWINNIEYLLLVLIFNYPINLKSLNYERIYEFTD